MWKKIKCLNWFLASVSRIRIRFFKFWFAGYGSSRTWTGSATLITQPNCLTCSHHPLRPAGIWVAAFCPSTWESCHSSLRRCQVSQPSHHSYWSAQNTAMDHWPDNKKEHTVGTYLPTVPYDMVLHCALPKSSFICEVGRYGTVPVPT